MSLLREAWNAVTDLVLPPACARCSCDLFAPAVRPFLCDECRGELRLAPVTRCGRCAARVGLATTYEAGCVLCRDARLRFDRVLTLGGYDGALREAVLRMKRSRDEPLSIAVGQLVAGGLDADLRSLKSDVILPVPMHWRRRLRRSTNSPELMVEMISAAIGVPWSRRSLRRIRDTTPQGELSPGKRKENVRGAFWVTRQTSWKDLRVLLVDDILTTGATCSEIARELKRAGASRVDVVVAARAQGRL
jgi:ComF family protein